MSRVRLGSDRDLMAIVVNLKEQRCLQKCLQTIDLEQTYATKILDLDHRILKIYFKRLKEKVSRIRSNLSAEEIVHLKKLENDGRLKASYIPVASNSSLKIAAGYRRLKLRPNCSESSSKMLKDPEKPDIKLEIQADEDQQRIYDAPTTKVFSSADPIENLNKTKQLKSHVRRPLTSFSSAKERCDVHQLLRRPSTAPISFIQGGDQLQDEMNTRFSRDSDRGSNFGENFHDEKRKERLQSEVNKGKILDRKTKDFLDNLNQFDSFPPLSKANLENSADRMAFKQKPDPEKSGQSMKTLSLDFNQNGRSASRDQYQEELMSLWKDLNKCRYLRVADELLDLSGVVNLAKNQMKHFVNIHGFGLAAPIR